MECFEVFNYCYERKILNDNCEFFIYVLLVDIEKRRKDYSLYKNGILFSIYILNK